MSTRVLSKEEREALSSGAVELIYKYLTGDYCPPEVIEKTLLHAIVVSRLNQCLVDTATLTFLIEKIAEYEGAPLFGQGRDEQALLRWPRVGEENQS
ncbi:MAG: hypothetical protein LBU26_01800 [Synergistaceae bacterium]|jgi:hypothetical protein|nr:hypothetical protein [Synergistaceae bacterium]